MTIGCCFTGHRHIPENVAVLLHGRLREIIATLHAEMGINAFYVGGCTGFDTLAAQAVLEYSSEHPAVKLIVVVPYRDQSKAWSLNDKSEYERILALASDVIYLSEHYFQGCMHRRNRYMVDKSIVCVCYLNQNKGGTFSTVKYAKGKGINIYNLANSCTLLWKCV